MKTSALIQMIYYYSIGKRVPISFGILYTYFEYVFPYKIKSFNSGSAIKRQYSVKFGLILIIFHACFQLVTLNGKH